MEGVTKYFEKEILKKRSYLTIGLCRETILKAIKKEVQPDGRIRFWSRLNDSDKYLRVVTLEDGFTIHNAFLDRGFKS